MVNISLTPETTGVRAGRWWSICSVLLYVVGSAMMARTTSTSFHVAPMMKHTDRHFRKLFRLISRQAVLYTEMIVDETIIELAQRDPQKLDLLLNFEPDQSTVLQIGGRDPKKIKQAINIAVSLNLGYAGYNLNVGCPSSVVASENSMGVAMMKDPLLTAECCNAIQERLTPFSSSSSSSSKTSSVPNVSIKCRIGVDEFDSYEFLHNFIEIIVSNSSVRNFQIHARKGLLGAGTIANRIDSLAPLRYEYVYRLVKDFPDCKFVLNGGITTLEDCVYHLKMGHVDGVMVGRGCVNSPYLWSDVDSMFKDTPDDTSFKKLSRGEILERYIEYCKDYEIARKKIDKPIQTHMEVAALTAPCFNLFVGEEGSDKFQRTLKKSSRHVTSPAQLLNCAKVYLSPDALNNLHAKSISSLKIYPKAHVKTGRNNRRIV